MTDRRTFVGVIACGLLAARCGWAQQVVVRRIGTPQNTPPSTPDAARLSRVFTQALGLTIPQSLLLRADEVVQ